MERIQPFFENLWDRIVSFFEQPTRRNLTIGIVLLILASFLIEMPNPHVSIAAEPIFEKGLPWFTNAVFATIVIDILLIVLALYVRSNIKEIPSGFMNFIEFVIESLYNLTESVAGKNARKFFPWVATIFIMVIISNYSGLVPGVGSIGIFHEYHGGEAEHSLLFNSSIAAADESLAVEALNVAQAAEEGGKKFIPIYRPPSADLNFTFALALITMFMVQFWGVRALGGNYFTKFFNFNTGKGFMRGIFAFSGILELFSEFAKIISFAFRLFGNIFAGEVLLGVMTFLVAFLVPVAFYGLELFVGFIQALVFMMLAVVFFSTAVISHGDHGDHH
ncbi:MAG: F0F1 ATP synthase subunit A [Caldilineaceae bacterium]|nr:F0F1 ATP synthase subunit A [Caldilineaceae bacterium]